MALFRRFFYRKPPDRLLEISDRVYVFDRCFKSDELEEHELKEYMSGIVPQLQDFFPDASFMVFNFREGERQSQISDVLSEYDMTVMDYPRQYEGCPLLPLEMIGHFLRSCESWLCLEGQHNVVLLHCETGAWPVLAFMITALLLYGKQFNGEKKTLEMIYRQAPKELLRHLSPLDPQPSQLRYLSYISKRNMCPVWPPSDILLCLDCLLLRVLPLFEDGQGCRPIIRIYGQDPLTPGNRSSKLLFSTAKTKKHVHHYLEAECMLVKIEIHCSVQGDVVLECIHLHEDLVREEMIFRVMFNTAFVRSNILMLNREEVDVLWDDKDQFSKEFRAEVLFSDGDAIMPNLATAVTHDEGFEKEFSSLEEFDEVEEIFNYVEYEQEVRSDNGIYQKPLENAAEDDTNDHKEEASTSVDDGHLYKETKYIYVNEERDIMMDDGDIKSNIVLDNFTKDKGNGEENAVNRSDQTTSGASGNSSTAIYGIGGVGSNTIQMEHSKNKFNYGEITKTVQKNYYYSTMTTVTSGQPSTVSAICPVGSSKIHGDHKEDGLDHDNEGCRDENSSRKWVKQHVLGKVRSVQESEAMEPIEEGSESLEELVKEVEMREAQKEKVDEMNEQNDMPGSTTSNCKTLVISRRKLLSFRTISMDVVSSPAYANVPTLSTQEASGWPSMSRINIRGSKNGINYERVIVCFQTHLSSFVAEGKVTTKLWIRGCRLELARLLEAYRYIRAKEVSPRVTVETCLAFSFPLLLFLLWRRIWK